MMSKGGDSYTGGFVDGMVIVNSIHIESETMLILSSF